MKCVGLSTAAEINDPGDKGENERLSACVDGLFGQTLAAVHKLKLTLGVLMIAALFVPLSQCSRGGKENALPPPAKTGLQKIFPRSDAQTDYDYGATRLAPSLNGAVTLVAFTWPLGLALLELRTRGKRRDWLLYVLELLLCGGTVWFIYALTEAGPRLWGAWFVFALTTGYALAALFDLFASLSRSSARLNGS